MSDHKGLSIDLVNRTASYRPRMLSLNPQTQALSMSALPGPWGEDRLPTLQRHPCLLLAQSDDFKLESCLYHQLPPAHRMP